MKKIYACILSVLLAGSLLSGCSQAPATEEPATPVAEPAQESDVSPEEDPGAAAEAPAEDPAPAEAPAEGDPGAEGDPAAEAPAEGDPGAEAPAPENPAPQGGGTITFGEGEPVLEGSGARIVSDGIRIEAGGSYTLRGNGGYAAVSVYAPGQSVQLILDGVSLSSSDGPALSIDLAASAEIVLGGAESSITSSARTSSTATPVPAQFNSATGGALHSEAPLTVSGEGTLMVTAIDEHAIQVRNNFTQAGGRLLVQSRADGIRVSNGVVSVQGGRLFANAQTNGINSQRDIQIGGGSIFTFGGVQNGGYGLLAGGSVVISGGAVTSTGGFSKKPTGPQPSLVMNYAEQPDGTTFTVSGPEGGISTFEVPGDSKSLVFSNPALQPGTEYSLTAADAVVATAVAEAG